MTSQKLFDSPNPREVTLHSPERFILIQRPIFWSYIAASLLVGAGVGAGVWAAIARFDQTVSATGTLELQEIGQEIKAPANGAVQEIYVKEGDEVETNDPLATFKVTISEAELESLRSEKARLIQENQLYDEVLKGGNPVTTTNAPSLIQLRTQLVQQTQYYQTLVTQRNLEEGASSAFTANQQKLVAASSPELQSRASAAQLQIQELEKRQSQTQEKLTAAEKLLAVNQDILDQLTQVSQDVAVPRQQYQRQKQDVLNNQAEIDKFQTEQQRVKGELSQAKEELAHAIALSLKDVLTQISENQTRLTQIDAQIKQAQLNNQTRIAQIDAALNQAEAPQGQLLKSPVDGVVFAVQSIAPGSVAQGNQTLLTVMPNNSVVASVVLNHQDLGLVEAGMDVDVKPSTLPNSRGTSVEGELVWVGAEVLPPALGRPYYAVPAKVQLERPVLQVDGNPVRLQAGMPVNCEIILSQKLTVWDVMQEKFDERVRTVLEVVK